MRNFCGQCGEYRAVKDGLCVICKEESKFANVQRTETIEVVLMSYEDDENSFDISFEFEYTYNQIFNKEHVERCLE